MADDTETPQPEAAPDVQAPDDPLESPPADTPETSIAVPQNQEQYETEKAHAQAYTQELDRTVKRHREVNSDNYNQLTMEVQKLKELQAEPDPERPVPYALPAGPSNQNQLGPALANLFKFAGLMAIAGLAGRGRGAVGTAALAGALRGWTEGRNNHRDAALGMYERQRQAVIQLNKDQNARYKEILDNKKLKFTQMFDVVREEASRVGNYRMMAAAERQDLKAVNDAVKAEDKINSDYTKQTRKDRPHWWSAMGKDEAKYRDWVREQGGPSITSKTSDEDWDKIEQQYPVSKFLEQEKKDDEADKAKRAEQESYARERGTLRAKKEAEGDTGTPGGSLSDEQKKKLLQDLLPEE